MFLDFFNKKELIIIIGVGRFGAKIAGELSMVGNRVKVIDKSNEAFRKLPDYFSGYSIVGNGGDVSVLKNADIENCQAVVITTNSDNDNIYIAHVAKKIFNIENVYVRIYDDSKKVLIDKLGIKTICPFELSLIEFKRLSGAKYNG